jgi:hypothetical protein
MRTTAAFLPALALLALVIVAPAGAQEAPETFDGSFRYAGSMEDARRRASEAASPIADQVGVFARGRVRGNLERAAAAPESIRIHVDASRIEVHVAGSRGEQTFASAPGGSLTVSGDDGSMRVTQVWRDGRLRQTFRNAEGATVTRVYTPTESGLTLTVTVRNERLPEPMTVRYRYRQAS